jgi:hypothetical protein
VGERIGWVGERIGCVGGLKKKRIICREGAPPTGRMRIEPHGDDNNDNLMNHSFDGHPNW